MLSAAAIPYPELLAYAQSLSAFTSAPPNMPDLAPGQPPPPLFFPPFPNEEKMRRGHMSDEAPLGILGETHSVGKRTSLTRALVFHAPAHDTGPAFLLCMQHRRFHHRSSFRHTSRRTLTDQTSGRHSSNRSSTSTSTSIQTCSSV